MVQCSTVQWCSAVEYRAVNNKDFPRSASKDRLAKGEKEKASPAQHNAAFDKMFEKAGSENPPDAPKAPARPSASTVPRPAGAGAASTLPRTYRRF